MQKYKIVSLIAIIILFSSAILYLSTKYIKVTGKVIWISQPKTNAFWSKTDISNSWWKDISKNQKYTIVYITPDFLDSKVTIQKNSIIIYTANWLTLGKLQILGISVNWDEWKKIDKTTRDNRLSAFVTQELYRYWNITNEATQQKIWDTKNLSISPIEIIKK